MPIKGTFLPFYKGGGLGCFAFAGWACLLAEGAWFLIHPSSWETPLSPLQDAPYPSFLQHGPHMLATEFGVLWPSEPLPTGEGFWTYKSEHEFKVKHVMNLRCFWLCWTVSHPQPHHSLDSKLTTSSSDCMCHPSAQCSLPCWNTEAAVLHELWRSHCATIFCP